jgi:hypothetical protein
VEIELYSNFRLLSYSSLKVESGIRDHFVAGRTECSHCQCSLHLQSIFLSVPTDYFQSSHIKTIQTILQSILTKNFLLHDTSDDTIKRIMNHHKKVTYVQTKKLMVVLGAKLEEVVQYQTGDFR